MGYPSFASGDVLLAADMNAVGLWLVKTQTIGSGVSDVTVSDVFSSTYDNYLITIGGGVASTTLALQLQLGTATSGYAYSFQYTEYSNIPKSAGGNNESNFNYAGSGTPSSLSMYCTLQNPNLADNTFIQASLANSLYAGTLIGYKNDTTQYTSFKIIAFSGTLTGGTIRVYGYRN